MKALLYLEHSDKKLCESSYHLISSAKDIGASIDIIITGFGIEDVIEQASKISGINKVIYAEHESLEHPVISSVSDILANLSSDYEYIICNHSSFGKSLLPRLAAKLDVMPISDVIEIVSPNSFKRSMYAGNIIANITSIDKIKLITIRSTSFNKVTDLSSGANIEKIEVDNRDDKIQFVQQSQKDSSRPDLTNAKTVVSGGRALKSAENFKLIEELADKLDAAVGATRAAVDAGYIANEYQVGQTGKIVAPDLYFAIGISGAIQHIAGIKDSKVIVAINSDLDAPIFKVADYGLVGDLFEIVPEIIKKLS